MVLITLSAAFCWKCYEGYSDSNWDGIVLKPARRSLIVSFFLEPLPKLSQLIQQSSTFNVERHASHSSQDYQVWSEKKKNLRLNSLDLKGITFKSTRRLPNVPREYKFKHPPPPLNAPPTSCHRDMQHLLSLFHEQHAVVGPLDPLRDLNKKTKKRRNKPQGQGKNKTVQ